MADRILTLDITDNLNPNVSNNVYVTLGRCGHGSLLVKQLVSQTITHGFESHKVQNFKRFNNLSCTLVKVLTVDFKRLDTSFGCF